MRIKNFDQLRTLVSKGEDVRWSNDGYKVFQEPGMTGRIMIRHERSGKELELVEKYYESNKFYVKRHIPNAGADGSTSA